MLLNVDLFSRVPPTGLIEDIGFFYSVVLYRYRTSIDFSHQFASSPCICCNLEHCLELNLLRERKKWNI